MKTTQKIVGVYIVTGFIESGKKQFAEGTEELELLLVREA